MSIIGTMINTSEGMSLKRKPKRLMYYKTCLNSLISAIETRLGNELYLFICSNTFFTSIKWIMCISIHTYIFVYVLVSSWTHAGPRCAHVGSIWYQTSIYTNTEKLSSLGYSGLRSLVC